jgi:peroxiredoxin
METFLTINIILLWLATTTALFISLGTIRQLNALLKQASRRPEMLSAGIKAPAFKLETLEGRIVSQADYGSRALGLVFISPTCNPCRQKMPQLQEQVSLAREVGIDLLIVSLVSREETRQFATEMNVAAPLFALPAESTLSEDYKVSVTPSFCFINKGGTVEVSGSLDGAWDKLVERWKQAAPKIVAIPA